MTLEEVVSLFANEHISRLSAVYRWRIPTAFPSGNLTPTGCPATDCKNLKAALNTAWETGNDVDKANLERWYVVDFGGVRGNKPQTLSHYSKMPSVELVRLGKQGIASWSKMLCVRDPINYQIFDARVAISLNCLLHSNGLVGQGVFPVLASQNQKIMRANRLLRDIKPRPPLRHEFYTEYCTVLQDVAGELTTPENPVSAMDLEMLLFALAENLIEKNLTLGKVIKKSKTLGRLGANQSKTLSQGKSFSYSGSPAAGTAITFGDGHSTQVTSDEYVLLRNHFQGTTVAIGASRTDPSPGSLGAWLQENLINRPAIASYVAPILIEAGWAVMVNTKTIHFL